MTTTYNKGLLRHARSLLVEHGEQVFKQQQLQGTPDPQTLGCGVRGGQTIEWRRYGELNDQGHPLHTEHRYAIGDRVTHYTGRVGEITGSCNEGLHLLVEFDDGGRRWISPKELRDDNRPHHDDLTEQFAERPIGWDFADTKPEHGEYGDFDDPEPTTKRPVRDDVDISFIYENAYGGGEQHRQLMVEHRLRKESVMQDVQDRIIDIEIGLHAWLKDQPVIDEATDYDDRRLIPDRKPDLMMCPSCRTVDAIKLIPHDNGVRVGTCAICHADVAVSIDK